MTSEEMVVKVAETDHRARSNTRRIEKLELQTEAIQELATSVKVMVSELGHQTESIQRIETSVKSLDTKMDAKVGELDEKIDTEVGKLDTRLDVVEKKPARRWENFVDKVIWAVAAALIGFVLAQIGLA